LGVVFPFLSDKPTFPIGKLVRMKINSASKEWMIFSRVSLDILGGGEVSASISEQRTSGTVKSRQTAQENRIQHPGLTEVL
jgi:hypothetical protein